MSWRLGASNVHRLLHLVLGSALLGACASEGVAPASVFDANESPSFQAGDGRLEASPEQASLERDIGHESNEGEVDPPVGYVRFAAAEFDARQEALRLWAELDHEPASDAFFRVYVSVTTELAQTHHEFDVRSEGAREQPLEVDFARLALETLAEKVGTLAVTVELHEAGTREVLYRAGHANASGLHLSYHVDRDGLSHAYLPQRRAKYQAEWARALRERPALHARHAFAQTAEVARERALSNVEHRHVERERVKPLSLVAPNVRICPLMNCEFVDAGQGETWWPSPALTARPMYGAQYKLFQNGTEVVSGYLSAEDGCIDMALANGSYEIEFWARASIWGNTFQVQNISGQTRFKTYAFQATSTFTTLSPNLTDSAAQERWNVFEALIRSGRKHGIGTGHHYLFKYDPRYDASWNGTEGRIGETQSGRKFLIAHEFGHGLQDKGATGIFSGAEEVGEDADGDGTCDVAPTPDVDCRSHTGTGANNHCTQGGSHKMWSLEHTSLAAKEGWAHFVAADVWNDHANGSCAFSYWRQKGQSGYRVDALNCATGDADFPVRFMRTTCNTNSAWFGSKGVEVDWMRAFWDIHTAGTSPSSMSLMVDLLDVSGVNNTNIISKLEARADDLSANLRSNWDSAKSVNGL